MSGLLIAIDTATEVGSVAVGDGERVVSELTIAQRRHAASLTPAVAEVLRVADVSWDSVTGLIVADGPGSFTGLRIGFATAKGILLEHAGLRLWTAPSLLSAARGVWRVVGGPVAAVYDALRGEVFAAVYDFVEGANGQGSAVQVLVAPSIVTVEDLMTQCSVPPVVAVGGGAVAYADHMERWTGRAPVGPSQGVPRAGALLDLFPLDGGVTEIECIADYEPIYGRLAEAQARWERAHGRPLPDTTGENR